MFNKKNTDMFSLDNGLIKRNIHNYYKTNDSKYLNIIIDNLYNELFITYFEVNKDISKKEYKNAIGKPIVYETSDNKYYFPIFTQINNLIEWKPNIVGQVKITNLYLNYLDELLNNNEYSYINGYIINPKSKENLIITKETLKNINSKLTEESVMI